MSNFNKFETELSKYDISVDMILDGEPIELEPEKKIKKKESYLRFELAQDVVNSCVNDLHVAYTYINELEAKNKQLEEEVQDISASLKTSSDQLKTILASEEGFEQAEALLTTFEQQMDVLVKDKAANVKKIQTLTNEIEKQVEELQTLREVAPRLKATVEELLEKVKGYFEEYDLSFDYDKSSIE